MKVSLPTFFSKKVGTLGGDTPFPLLIPFRGLIVGIEREVGIFGGFDNFCIGEGIDIRLGERDLGIKILALHIIQNAVFEPTRGGIVTVEIHGAYQHSALKCLELKER